MKDSMRRAAAILLVMLGGAALWWAGDGTKSSAVARERAPAGDPRLKGGSRFEEGGWIYVHLEGDPEAIGYQHGFLLAPEIEDAFAAVSAGMTHSTGRDRALSPQAAREMLSP